MYKRALLLTLATLVTFSANADETILNPNVPQIEQTDDIDSTPGVAGCSCKKKGNKPAPILATDTLSDQAEEVNVEEEPVAATLANESDDAETSQEAIEIVPIIETV